MKPMTTEEQHAFDWVMTHDYPYYTAIRCAKLLAEYIKRNQPPTPKRSQHYSPPNIIIR
jgi:hypothetical protein